MLLFEEDKSIQGTALAMLWDACFDQADVFSLCTAIWTQATNDALEKALMPYRLRGFRTARWFCHWSTEPFLEVNLYEANEETRSIVKQHVRDLYFDLSRNRDLHTLEDLCFFREDQLFFGTVSHEGICMAQPATQEFAALLQNFGMWSNHEDRFAKINLADF